MIVFTPSGKVIVAEPILFPFDSVSSVAVIVFPETLKDGALFTGVIDNGSPTSDVTTTLSFHSLSLESISVISICRLLTALVSVMVVVTAEFPEPALGSKLIPRVGTPPKALFSIFG